MIKTQKKQEQKIKDLEREIDIRPSTEKELQEKLTAAESLCEDLMDENEEMKRELRSLEDEIEELQDNFRFVLSVDFSFYYLRTVMFT